MKTTRKNYKKRRIAIFRSNKHIYAQIIDDKKQITLVSASDHELYKNKGKEKKKKDSKNATKVEKAYQVGMLLAKKAKEKKIKNVYFDRRKYKYHGRVKALAEGLRKGGLSF